MSIIILDYVSIVYIKIDLLDYCEKNLDISKIMVYNQ